MFDQSTFILAYDVRPQFGPGLVFKRYVSEERNVDAVTISTLSSFNWPALPGELQREILSHIIPNNSTITPNPCVCEYCCNSPRKYGRIVVPAKLPIGTTRCTNQNLHNPCSLVGLLRVSKTVSADCLNLLYRSNCFRFDFREHMHSFARKVGEANLQKITKLKIAFPLIARISNNNLRGTHSILEEIETFTNLNQVCMDVGVLDAIPPAYGSVAFDEDVGGNSKLTNFQRQFIITCRNYAPRSKFAHGKVYSHHDGWFVTLVRPGFCYTPELSEVEEDIGDSTVTWTTWDGSMADTIRLDDLVDIDDLVDFDEFVEFYAFYHFMTRMK